MGRERDIKVRDRNTDGLHPVSPQPGHVALPGIKPAIFLCTKQYPTNRAIPDRVNLELVEKFLNLLCTSTT